MASRSVSPTLLGRQAAVRAFETIEGGQLEEFCITDECREPGSPQRDLIGEALARLPADQLAGFTSMLTDVIASSVHSGVPSMEWLKVLAAHEPPEAAALWDKMHGQWPKALS